MEQGSHHIAGPSANSVFLSVFQQWTSCHGGLNFVHLLTVVHSLLKFSLEISDHRYIFLVFYPELYFSDHF